MADINTLIGSITGSTGATAALEAKAGYKVWILPRGAYASAAGSASPIQFDSAQVASRFQSLEWVQVGADAGSIRQISAVAGNSLAYIGSNLSIPLNARILRVGLTEPVLTSGNATYVPNVATYQRDDDTSTLAGASSVTDANGTYILNGADGLFDLLIQDANGTNQGFVADVEIGPSLSRINVDLTPSTSGGASLGTCALPFSSLRFTGMIESGITSAGGRTAFNFDTCNAITAGSLFSFGNTGSVAVYGDTWGGLRGSYTMAEVVNPHSQRFGARGDNSTDDGPAINNASTFAETAANGADGTVVQLQKGTYIVNTQITVPPKTILRGRGQFSTWLKAGASFPAATPLVRLGGSTATAAAAMRVENLSIDCNAVTGSIGLFSAWCIEESGCRDVSVWRAMAKGMHFSGVSAQNFDIERCFIAMDGLAGATSIGIHLDGTAGIARIERTGIGNDEGNSTQSVGAGIYSQHSIGNPAYIANGRFEQCYVGVRIGSNSNTIINNIEGTNHTPVLVAIDGPGGHNTVATGIWPSGSPIGLSDSFYGVTSSNDLPFYVSQNNPSGANLLTSDRNLRWFVPNTVSWSGAVGFSGSVAGDMETVASAGSLSAANRNALLITGSATIHTITSGVTGQMLELIGASGAAAPLTDGNTLHLGGVFTLGATDVIGLRCIDGVSWAERYRSNN